jgi:hypothetical protein
MKTRYLVTTLLAAALPIAPLIAQDSLSSDFAEEATQHGAFLARESTLDRDLSYFLACLGFAHFESIPGAILGDLLHHSNWASHTVRPKRNDR